MQTVYVDLFFLVNFSMDFLCLFLTARLLHRRFPTVRALLAAGLGGLYADLSLFLPTSVLWGMALDGLVCLVLCWIVFHQRGRWRTVLLPAAVFVAVSMVLGGCMTALFYFFNRLPALEGIEQAEGDGISVWVFALLALISGAITLLGGRFFGGRVSRRNARITVSYHGKTVRLQAMTDSGNLLREPMSGRPCIVADVGAMAAVLPRELIAAARQNDPTLVGGLAPHHGKNVRLIPTRTASGEGMLLGIRVDRIVIEGEKRSREVEAMIALADLGGNAEGNDALLPPQLLIS